MKPILIGQAPGPKTDPRKPLDPNSTTSRRIAALAGTTADELSEAFELVNLLHSFPGKWRRDDKWPVRDARIAAQAIRPFVRGRRVVLLGRNVSEGFGFSDSLQFHDWNFCDEGHFEFAVVPHPSGRNVWYRNPENFKRAEAFWTELRFSSIGLVY